MGRLVSNETKIKLQHCLANKLRPTKDISQEIE